MKNVLIAIVLFGSLLHAWPTTNSIDVSSDKIVAKSGDLEFVLNFPPQDRDSEAGQCVSRAFMVDEESFHAEYVKLGADCEWTGLASRFFIDFMKRKVENVEKLKGYEVEEIEIAKYSKDGGEFYVITTYDTFGDLFVIDYDGSIATQVCKSCELIPESKRADFRFKESLVENNMLGK
ncbi:MAG: hypothetical protein ACLFOC_03420, partial [Campylobacterales bacterium]